MVEKTAQKYCRTRYIYIKVFEKNTTRTGVIRYNHVGLACVTRNRQRSITRSKTVVRMENYVIASVTILLCAHVIHASHWHRFHDNINNFAPLVCRTLRATVMLRTSAYVFVYSRTRVLCWTQKNLKNYKKKKTR